MKLSFRHIGWQIALGVILIGLSVVLYAIHFSIFHDAHHIFIYLLGDIAFVPIEVLLVTLIIHRLLGVHEKRSALEKLNMVIGTFFSQVGIQLLSSFSQSDPQAERLHSELIVKPKWQARDFQRSILRVKQHPFHIEYARVDIVGLRDFLRGNREFLLRLLENPVLREHQPFTDLMHATFHLTEELCFRKDFASLPQSDREHLANDMKRVYGLLTQRWLFYMRYLKRAYPYLFSLAMRLNPFDSKASVVIRG